jgi:hypothetical protein
MSILQTESHSHGIEYRDHLGNAGLQIQRILGYQAACFMGVDLLCSAFLHSAGSVWTVLTSVTPGNREGGK